MQRDEPRVSVPDHYWAEPTSKLLDRLGVTESGLSEASARSRLETYGPNRLSRARRGPLLQAVISQASNPLLWLLLLAAAIGMLVGEATDSAIVLAILAIGAAISIAQESRAGRALQRLRDRVALRVRVQRDGAEAQIEATAVVPGDILLLDAGTLISADAVLLQARDLFIGEAALTGEPYAVQKLPGPVGRSAPLAARSNVVHMGTDVRSGMGRAVVVATGARTAFGKIAGRLSLRPPETEFQHGLRRFGYLLLSIMIVLVFVVVAASALRHHPPIEALLFAIALAVGLAPEMLPAILATMLARGARRMARRGVMVRRLEAIENLGNMDVLCTDKTGTLTEGDIRLEAATDPSGEVSERVFELAVWNARLQAGMLNPMDRAIVAADTGHAEHLPTKLDEIPFDFARKRVSVLVEGTSGQPLLVTKGSAESVLDACASMRAAGGELHSLTPRDRENIASRVTEWSRDGVRVLSVATRAWSEGDALDRDAERELVLEGFATFRDPPKEGAADAARDLGRLGVRVVVVSGDHRDVVAHLANQIGLGKSAVIRGTEIAQLRDEALWHVAQRNNLFAEVEPTQKERLVMALKKTGHVVGFMGDGINDAPAMHAADVGISVEGATDVAREAADFVLLQRDLDTVRDGIQEGRVTFANTLKYVLTTESANLGNMMSMAAAALFLPFLPLLAHQVLLNNLLSDIPSTTLATDRVDSEAMLRPQRWDVAYIRNFMMLFGSLSAVFDGITFVVLTRVLHAAPAEFRTAWFAESLLTELFVLLVLRTRRRAWKSRPRFLLVGSTLAVAALTLWLPLSPIRGTLGFVDVSWWIWAWVLAITVAYVASVELLKRPLMSFIEARVRRTRPRRLPAVHRVWPR